MSKRLKTEATTSNPRSNANSGSNSAARTKNPAPGSQAPADETRVAASGQTAERPLKQATTEGDNAAFQRRKGAVTRSQTTAPTQTTDN